MRKNYTNLTSFKSIMRKAARALRVLLFLMILTGLCNLVQGQSGRQNCSNKAPNQQCGMDRDKGRPECGLEITCSDETVTLGYSEGVCFRATCPGIVAILHNRADEASFRRRFFTYRHYTYKGSWELKDDGLVESGPVKLRELFLVLPEDLIEFRMADSDCNAAIHMRSLGYIKKGNVCELQRWLAFHRFMETPALTQVKSSQTGSGENCATGEACGMGVPSISGVAILDSIFSLGRAIGIPLGR